MNSSTAAAQGIHGVRLEIYNSTEGLEPYGQWSEISALGTDTIHSCYCAKRVADLPVEGK